jgi:hypothetical protein
VVFGSIHEAPPRTAACQILQFFLAFFKPAPYYQGFIKLGEKNGT